MVTMEKELELIEGIMMKVDQEGGATFEITEPEMKELIDACIDYNYGGAEGI